MGAERFSLWQAGTTLRELTLVDDLSARLASWEASTTPVQMAMSAYLTRLQAEIEPHLGGGQHLYLRMEIGVPTADRLTHHYDLENYLTPVVQRLGSQHFVLASATKRLGGDSILRVGIAEPWDGPTERAGFGHFAFRVGQGPQIKANLRDALEAGVQANQLTPLPDPSAQAEVHLAWRCAPARRRWHNLWKLTGDAMGPILGGPHAHQPFNPYDDRITALHLHRTDDAAMGYDVAVGLWWRARHETAPIRP